MVPADADHHPDADDHRNDDAYRNSYCNGHNYHHTDGHTNANHYA